MYSFYLYVLIYTNSHYFCIVADFITGVISTGSEAKFLNGNNECTNNLLSLEIAYQL